MVQCVYSSTVHISKHQSEHLTKHSIKLLLNYTMSKCITSISLADFRLHVLMKAQLYHTLRNKLGLIQLFHQRCTSTY